jgi:DNA repair protein RadD
MVGRGFRRHPGKGDCLVLDFGGNVLRHGPVDAIRLVDPNSVTGEAPAKQCPQCDALIHAAYAVCPECGHVFPPRQQVKHTAIASDEDVMTDGEGSHRQDLTVSEVSYHVHFKRGDPLALPTMRVEYQCGFAKWVREWLCFDHPPGGYARRKAEQWWRARSNDPVPGSVEEAVDLAEAGALAEPSRITVEQKPGDQWERIVAYQLGPKPPRLESDDDLPDVPETVGAAYGIPDDEIPF